MHFNVPHDWFETNSRHQKRYSEGDKNFRGCRSLLGSSRTIAILMLIKPFSKQLSCCLCFSSLIFLGNCGRNGGSSSLTTTETHCTRAFPAKIDLFLIASFSFGPLKRVVLGTRSVFLHGTPPLSSQKWIQSMKILHFDSNLAFKRRFLSKASQFVASTPTLKACEVTIWVSHYSKTCIKRAPLGPSLVST